MLEALNMNMAQIAGFNMVDPCSYVCCSFCLHNQLTTLPAGDEGFRGRKFNKKTDHYSRQRLTKWPLLLPINESQPSSLLSISCSTARIMASDGDVIGST